MFKGIALYNALYSVVFNAGIKLIWPLNFNFTRKCRVSCLFTPRGGAIESAGAHSAAVRARAAQIEAARVVSAFLSRHGTGYFSEFGILTMSRTCHPRITRTCKYHKGIIKLSTLKWSEMRVVLESCVRLDSCSVCNVTKHCCGV